MNSEQRTDAPEPGPVPGSPRERPARDPDAPVSLDSGSSPERPGSKPLSATLERLEAHTPDEARYELEGEIARGGMGIIQRVWDGDLRRSIARKILGKDAKGSDSRKSDPRTIGRFLEEAQVTAQLEHPGIVPVHELGVDKKGTLYFTMRMVRGEDLHRIFEHARTGQHGWSQTRTLHVLLKVCEAMAFAHKKGVIHRDLKPSNVMVGRFGETYVMDWGLARVLGEREGKDLRFQAAPPSNDVRTDRGGLERTPDSPLLTRDGDVVGTPAYMSPEQARGELARLGPATDVYALGAMLYHLLSGRVPYTEPGRKLGPHSILSRVMDGPPPRIETLAPATPPELVAICDKAMARELERRYATMLELAEDLRAYLEMRVVRAYRTGPVVELAKWVRRNRLSAASLAALVLAVAGGGLSVAWQQSVRAAEESLRRDELLAESLVASAEQLWPIHPSRVADMEAWLTSARAIAAGLPQARVELEVFERAHASAVREEEPLPLAVQSATFELASLEARLEVFTRSLRGLVTRERPSETREDQFLNELAFAAINRAVLEIEVPDLERLIERRKDDLAAFRSWHYGNASSAREHERLTRRVEHLASLTRPQDGAIARIEVRRTTAASLEETSLAQHAKEWEEACASIADPARCPPYAGLRIEPQLGLVPLGQDQRTKLWEFWHVLTGARPERGSDGNFVIGPETGIVLVLVPGGAVTLGSQDEDPAGPNYFAAEEGIDQGLRPVDRWIADVELYSYFLSKYELTQGQWLRMTGENPSEHRAGMSFLGMARLTRSHPVESVSWTEASEVLGHYGLELPTEAQWERAARAGTQTKYAAGATVDAILDFANFGDESAERAGFAEALIPFDDGFALHAPVDALRQDAWGFHGLFGNVEEWCRDWYASSCERGRIQRGTGEHVPKSSQFKAYRGGGFRSTPDQLWVSSRHRRFPQSIDLDLGVRPGRALLHHLRSR